MDSAQSRYLNKPLQVVVTVIVNEVLVQAIPGPGGVGWWRIRSLQAGE
jgi:hypothetical protein